MIKVENDTKVKRFELANEHGRMITRARYCDDGTIEITNAPFLYEGRSETIVLGRGETAAVIDLVLGPKDFGFSVAQKRQRKRSAADER